MGDLSLDEKIVLVRSLMEKYGRFFGLAHPYTIQMSQVLDRLILIEQNKKRERVRLH